MKMIEQTSLETYKELKEEKCLGSAQSLVYNYLLNHPDSTDVEIMTGLKLTDPNKVRPRRKELFDFGLIRKIHKRKCDITNRSAYSWGVV